MRATEGVTSRGQDLGLVSQDKRLFVESGQLENPHAKNGHGSQKSIDGKVLFFYRTFQFTGSSPRTGASQALKEWWLRNKQLRVLTGRWDISITTPPHPFQGSGDVMEWGRKRMHEPKDGEDYCLWTWCGCYTDESTIPGATHTRSRELQVSAQRKGGTPPVAYVRS